MWHAALRTAALYCDDQKVKFTFYILESRYNHGSNLKGIYPSDDWLTSIPAEDVKGYNADTDQDKLNGVKYFYDASLKNLNQKYLQLYKNYPHKS